jgi:hypothetical protein
MIIGIEIKYAASGGAAGHAGPTHLAPSASGTVGTGGGGYPAQPQVSVPECDRRGPAYLVDSSDLPARSVARMGHRARAEAKRWPYTSTVTELVIDFRGLRGLLL